MKWILFIYKVPSKPTKYRAYVWREIKKFGAIYLQDSVFILPDLDDVQLFIDNLSEKIHEFGGQEYTFVSSLMSEERDNELIEQFHQAREKEYRELQPKILQCYEMVREEEMWEFSASQVRKLKSDYQKLLRQFQTIQARDYFENPYGKKLHLMFNECRKHIYRS